MRTIVQKITVAGALALIGSVAQAAILAPSGGSEAIITFVNGNNDSISFDTGDTSLDLGDAYALPEAILGFIAAAGGPSGVQFGIIGGNTTARRYFTSAPLETFGSAELGNSNRNGFASALNQFAQDLDSSPLSSGTANATYGAFLTGSGSPNYIDAGYDTWQTGIFEFSNLGLGTDPLLLYSIQFAQGASQLGFATIQALGLNEGTPLIANLDLQNSRIEIAAVPAPAAVWLLGTALVPVARRVLRKRAAASA
jgi:hypothetical protein